MRQNRYREFWNVVIPEFDVSVFCLGFCQTGQIEILRSENMAAAERRLKIMKVLCQRRHETMRNLANEFEVSIRTIQRDMDEISHMIPIYMKYGRYEGGVYVMDGYYMDRMYMEEKELELLNKVKNISAKNQKVSLNETERQLLENIIQLYTKPASA